MLGRSDPQEQLVIIGSLRRLIPDDHILARVDQVLDLSWLREEVRGLYCADNGRPSLDPEAAVRLMLGGFFAGIVHDRKLMREAQVNLALRWFARFGLDEELPDHSSLTRLRQRWGQALFQKIFQRTVQACIDAGLVDGETVHVDATLIRADVSWRSVTAAHAQQVWQENAEEQEGPRTPGKGGRPRKKEAEPKKVSTTDPEATLATSQHDYHLEPSYKQHTAVDDRTGVVVDAEVTTGEANEGRELLRQVERVETLTGTRIEMLTADAGYAHGRNYQELEERATVAVIPPQRESTRSRKIPLRRFKYDGRRQRVKCPRGCELRRSSYDGTGWIYRARAKGCRGCPWQARCVSPSAAVRTVKIVDGYEALLRARRGHRRWSAAQQLAYQRHRWRVEGIHGEEKTQHGLRRAVRRGLWNVAIQVYLTAAVVNLKRLAAFLWLLWGLLACFWGRVMAQATSGADNMLSQRERPFLPAHAA